MGVDRSVDAPGMTLHPPPPSFQFPRRLREISLNKSVTIGFSIPEGVFPFAKIFYISTYPKLLVNKLTRFESRIFIPVTKPQSKGPQHTYIGLAY